MARRLRSAMVSESSAIHSVSRAAPRRRSMSRCLMARFAAVKSAGRVNATRCRSSVTIHADLYRPSIASTHQEPFIWWPASRRCPEPTAAIRPLGCSARGNQRRVKPRQFLLPVLAQRAGFFTFQAMIMPGIAKTPSN
jgi:hypothetical protein